NGAFVGGVKGAPAKSGELPDAQSRSLNVGACQSAPGSPESLNFQRLVNETKFKEIGIGLSFCPWVLADAAEETLNMRTKSKSSTTRTCWPSGETLANSAPLTSPRSTVSGCRTRTSQSQAVSLSDTVARRWPLAEVFAERTGAWCRRGSASGSPLLTSHKR